VTRRSARGSGRGRAAAREAGEAPAAESSARPRRSPTKRTAAARARADAGEDRYDLLTAALIGAAVGATAMLLVRRPASRRVMRPLAEIAASEAGRRLLKSGAATLGARALSGAGRAAMPMVRDAASGLGDYVRTAREAIDDFVADEVRDLRKAIRRGRRRAGL
jgi:gas vesicle protein